MTFKRVALFGATLLFCLSGCSGLQIFNPPGEAARNFAIAHGFDERIHQAGQFQITSFERKPGQSKTLTVYIEGDGASWPASNVPPNDPSPRRLLVLQLAAKDHRTPLLYLARPCQFLDEKSLQQCPADYWTESRYADEVVAALDLIITQVMQEHGATRLNLVGYSGGGTIAMYIAARRHDVVHLMTIASPLNHALWTEYHGIAPLSGSLGKMENWQKLEKVQQFHFVGERDTVVPPALMRSMLPSHLNASVIPGFDHECCWSRDWEKLLAQTGLPNFPK